MTTLPATPIRKAVKKTLVETDITRKVLEALTDHDPKDIVAYMAKNTPRTLVDIMTRMKAPDEDPDEMVYTPGVPKGRTDWSDLKEALEHLYETGSYTHDDLIDTALELTEGSIDRYTAKMLVDEIFS
jgi:hypothetical protein